MNANIKQTQPNDLILAKEAAVMSERSKSSIRTWVRLNKLTGYKQDPNKKNSALMISKSELLAFLATNKSPDKLKQAGRPPDISASLSKLEIDKKEIEAEMKIAQEKIKMLERMLVQADQLSSTQTQAIEAAERRSAELRVDNELLKTDLVRTRLKLEQVTVYLSLPWWKKWNSSVPLLTG